MFDRTEPRPVFFEGTTASAPLQVAKVSGLAVIGTLFKGEIRQLHFDASGALIVLAGRGVRRLDPRTLAETGRWLADREVLAVHPCGDRLWVITDEAVFLAAFGGELGAPFAAVPQQRHHHTTAAGTRLVIPHERGATLLDAATGTSREFLIDAAWYATLFSPRPPDMALLSPSGRHVGVTVQHGSYTVVWDADTGASRMARAHSESSVLLDDTRLLHVNHGSGMLRSFVDDQWSRLPADDHFAGARVRGERLLVADSQGGFSLHDVGTLARVCELASFPKRHGRVSGSVCAALSDTHVATYAVMSGVLRISEIGGATFESSGWIGGAEALSLAQDGRRVGVFREWGNGRLDCVDLDAKQLVEVCGHHEDITNSAITGDGQKVVVPCGSILRARTVHVGEFGGAESTAVHPIRSCVHELLPYGADAYAVATYTLRGAGHVGLHQAGVARAIAKITSGKDSPWRIAVGQSAEELLVSWDSATILYDMRKRPKPVETWNTAAAAVALGPRGFLAFILGPDELHLRTPGSPLRALTLPPRAGHTSPRLAFSRDGSLLFVGASDGVLAVRRADDGALLRELPLHVGGFVALQRCGEAMWTMGADGVGYVLGVASA